MTSPVAIPSPRSTLESTSTTTSPVSTAIRIASSSVGSSSFSSSIARMICQAVCTARIASSSRDVGAPNKPTTASPMNFSTVPPRSSISSRARAK
jgi:hypothetical protein